MAVCFQTAPVDWNSRSSFILLSLPLFSTLSWWRNFKESSSLRFHLLWKLVGIHLFHLLHFCQRRKTSKRVRVYPQSTKAIYLSVDSLVCIQVDLFTLHCPQVLCFFLFIITHLQSICSNKKILRTRLSSVADTASWPPKLFPCLPGQNSKTTLSNPLRSYVVTWH